MPTPAWFALALAVLLAGATGYHVHGLLAAAPPRRTRLDVDVTHILMGSAMTAMVLGALPRAAGPWLVAGFAPAALWFTVAAVRRYVLDGPGRVGREAVQAVGCAAMAYMAAGSGSTAGAPMPGTAMLGMTMPGMAAPGVWPLLAGLLLAAVAAAALWTLRRARQCAGGPVAAGCQLAMSAAAAYMLAAML